MGWSPQIHTGFHVPRTTQDTAILPIFIHTGLSPSMARLSKRFWFIMVRISQSYNPDIAVTTSVWAVPRSLATTSGITFVFSSSGYLDVSVPRVCLQYPMYSDKDTAPLRTVGFPFGNLRIKAYLQLPEAYRC